MKVSPATLAKDKSRSQDDVSAQDMNNLQDTYGQPPRLLDCTVTDDFTRGRRPDLGTYVDIYIE